MVQDKQQTTAKKNGIPTWKVVLPIALVLVVLHSVIVSSIFLISQASNGMTQIMQTYSGYISDVTELQGGSSYLSEISGIFLLNPIPDGKDLNIGPMVGYETELHRPRRGIDIKNRFADREIDQEVRRKIEDAARNAERMIEIQMHATALTFSAYADMIPPTDDIKELQSYFPALNEEEVASIIELQSHLPSLTDEEAAMTKEEKWEKAFNLIAGIEYSNCKKAVSDNTSLANQAFQTEMQNASVTQLKKVNFFRTMLWIATVLVIDVLLVAFVLLIRWLVYPLRGFVRGIKAGTTIREDRGLAEVRLVAKSYNELLDRKTSLENALRSAAETDALTDLPNRYCMEQYLLQKGEKGVSVAFFLFDVNYLKRTNDKEGHLAGDALLKRAANCISACFASFPDAKCFRYGGDEFTAILKNCRQEDIDATIARLEEEQKNCKVSMAIGYAYAPDFSNTTIKALFSKADEKMYEHKKQIHSRDSVDENS